MIRTALSTRSRRAVEHRGRRVYHGWGIDRYGPAVSAECAEKAKFGSPMRKFDSIVVEQENGVSVIRFVDEKIMDTKRIQQVNDELNAVADDNQAGGMLLNMENVRFLSSAAINKLIVLDKRVKSIGGEIRLSNLRPEVRDVFSITNLDRLFSIYDNSAEALKSFASRTNANRREP
jgi:anti-anti-sigma factor